MDAIVLADDPRSRVRIAGLTVRERAVRVAMRAGATRVLVVADETPRATISSWRGEASSPLLVIRADQLVHTPLVAPLVAARDELGHDGLAVAVSGTDSGEYAGALLATGAAATAVAARLAAGEPDRSIAAAATRRIPHGTIARHSIDSAGDRSGAHRLLYKILVKPQDNAITRYLYRPVSLPLTRLLVWTPVTPNQVSYAVAVIAALGCWLTASASATSVFIGTAVVLASSYLDCCDGEIARLKLTSSRYGAWIDTVIDELSSIAYGAALGWHCHLAYGQDRFWLVATGLAVVTNLWSMYCIYYNIIVGVGSANSQDYAGRFDVVAGERPNTVRLRPIAQAVAPSRDRPAWLTFITTYGPYIARRDFLCWLALVLAAVGAANVMFWIFTIGAWLMVGLLTLDHVWLRRLLRRLARDGKQLLPAAR